MRKRDLDADPLGQFAAWFEEAGRAGIGVPEAMVLATAAATGEPSARMVLLKGYDGQGFVFYTGYQSRKGRELADNPRAALLFYWDRPLGRQVRIEGDVLPLSPAESDAYFLTRPPESRLGAWASRQSEVIESREVLENRVEEARTRFGNGEISRPPFWGGYRLSPSSFEFWQHRDDRLHDRVRYRRDAAGTEWVRERLSP